MGEVKEPGYLEGGDFCPASADLALVGVGLRSNMEAVKQLMEEDLFGSRRVAVVRDDFEQNQVMLHKVTCADRCDHARSSTRSRRVAIVRDDSERTR